MNTELFSTQEKTVVNHAGGAAYAKSAEEALAQLAVTACFGNTYYVDAKEQLDEVLKLAKQCDPKFVAQAAIYSRKKGYMKDMPVLLLAHLSTVDKELFKATFPKVVDNARMLRGFVQIVRSNAVGRKSFGSLPKKLIRKWLVDRDPNRLLDDSVGNTPSLGDIVKMVHPVPATKEQEGAFGYLIGKDKEILPPLFKEYEQWKRNPTDQTPKVSTRLLTSAELTTEQWTQIALRMGWQELRMNLNSLDKHGVFLSPGITRKLSEKLQDAEAIHRSRVFPYQILQAYLSTENLPNLIQQALQVAMEVAVENVPKFEGNIVVGLDVSGSMHSAITGSRAVSSKTTCLQVAALISAVILRKNQETKIIPFSDSIPKVRLNPLDSVTTIANVLSKLPSGGTNCALPLASVANEGQKVDAFVLVSDNESWINSPSYYNYYRTNAMDEWLRIKKKNPKAKLINIDLTPNTTTQLHSQSDILNIGGFSDNVFEVVRSFLNDDTKWIDAVKAIEV